jgi:hypothetical protein
MRVRLTLVLLLSIITVTVVFSQPLMVQGDPPAKPQEKELTPEEEEARGVGKRFRERWKETADFGQIIDEMFVKDFSERLWQVPRDELPWVFIDETLIVHASPQELRRYYAASMSFYGLYSSLCKVVESLREQSGNDEGSLKLAEVLSPEVISVLLGNQTLARIVELKREEESDEREKEDDNHQPAQGADSAQAQRTTAEANADDSTETSEVGIIKGIPQLNDASATLEKANELMRKRLLKMSRLAKGVAGKEDAESTQVSVTADLTSLDEAEYGYPKDTPVIRLEEFPFCLHLIKIDGHLMVLSAYICVD